MKNRSKEEILFKTVKEDNILPITSICKLNCIFCSHKNNPSQVETYSFGHLEKDLIKTMIEFLNPERPVFIGESASKIIEGEPFTHPDIYQILKYLRQRWSQIEIKITTSGSFIEVEKLKLLKQLKLIELNISLNAPTPKDRGFLMNDSKPENIFKIIPELKKLKLDFSASIVSMHHLKGFDYLKKTLDYLANYPPQSLRIFMAGFSDYADPEIISAAEEYPKLQNYISSIKDIYSYPIILEPQLLDNLKAEINDFIKNSPAAASNLIRGDIIESVDQKPVVSRVDAFYQVKKAENPVLEIQRSGKKEKIIIKKDKNKNSGLIMSYDLSLIEKQKLENYANLSKQNKKGLTVILASKAGYLLIESLISRYLVNNKNLKLLKVENKFFGASIIAAGLLTNSDLIKTLAQLSENIEKIILPAVVYDYYGNDLLGNHYSQLEEKFAAEVILI